MLYKYLLRTFFLFSFLFVELLTLNYNRLPHLLFLYQLWKVAILFHKDKKQLRILPIKWGEEWRPISFINRECPRETLCKFFIPVLTLAMCFYWWDRPVVDRREKSIIGRGRKKTGVAKGRKEKNRKAETQAKCEGDK